MLFCKVLLKIKLWFAPKLSFAAMLLVNILKDEYSQADEDKLLEKIVKN